MADGGGVWGREHRRLTAGLVLTISAIAFEVLAVATVLPATVADLGGLELYGWVFSGLLLTSIVGAVIGGRSADRRGPAPAFAVGVALFAAGLAVAGLAPSMPVLVAGRVVQGLGAGLVGAVAFVGIGRGYPAGLSEMPARGGRNDPVLLRVPSGKMSTAPPRSRTPSAPRNADRARGPLGIGMEL